MPALDPITAGPIGSLALIGSDGAGEVSAAVAATGTVTYTGTAAVVAAILAATVDAAVAATGLVTYTGTAAVSATVIDGITLVARFTAASYQERFESMAKSVSTSRLEIADFIGKLSAGVTITTAAVTQAVYSGSGSDLSILYPQITGSRIAALIGGGTAGVLYQLTFQATLSDGQVLRMSTLLAVTPDAV